MFDLFVDELNIRLSFLKRRWWDQFFYMLSMGGTFCFFYVTGMYASSGNQAHNHFGELLIGYILWILIFSIFNGISNSLNKEQAGALITILTSPIGTRKILFVRSVVDCLFQVSMLTPLFLLAALVTGIRVHLDGTMIIPLLAVMLSAVGFGYVLSGLQLVTKEINYTMQMSQYVLMFGIMGPVEAAGKWALVATVLLPGGPGAAAIRLLSQSSASANLAIALAVLNGALYFGAGAYLFYRAEKRARRLGPFLD